MCGILGTGDERRGSRSSGTLSNVPIASQVLQELAVPDHINSV